MTMMYKKDYAKYIFFSDFFLWVWVETWCFDTCFYIHRSFRYLMHICTAAGIEGVVRYAWRLSGLFFFFSSVSPEDSSESHLVCLWEMDSYFYARTGFSFQMEVGEGESSRLCHTCLCKDFLRVYGWLPGCCYPVSKLICCSAWLWLCVT